MGHSRPLFYFRLFNTVDSKQMFFIKVCQWLISNHGRWCWKQPLYQLSPQPLPNEAKSLTLMKQTCNSNRVVAASIRLIRPSNGARYLVLIWHPLACLHNTSIPFSWGSFRQLQINNNGGCECNNISQSLTTDLSSTLSLFAHPTFHSFLFFHVGHTRPLFGYFRPFIIAVINIGQWTSV